MIKRHTFEELEEFVAGWAADRKITQHSTALAQAIKTTEELAELLKALSRNDNFEAADAYGDILVTLIIGARISQLDLTQCLRVAYETIKDRKGYLTSDGIFVKLED